MLKLIIIILGLFFSCHSFSQRRRVAVSRYNEHITSDLANVGDKLNDSISIFLVRGRCKNPDLFILSRTGLLGARHVRVISFSKEPLVQIHGNVLYSFSYRSYLDTPFAQTDLMQHLAQANLRVLIKNKYPLQIAISNRNSNSPYFQNTMDVNVQYNRRQLLDNIKDRLREKAGGMLDTAIFIDAEQRYLRRKKQVEHLQAWINNPIRQQEIIEEKERSLTGKLFSYRTSAISKMKDELSGFRNGWRGLVGKFKRPGDFKNLGDLIDLLKLDNSKDSSDDHRRKGIVRIFPKMDSSYIEKYNSKKKEFAELEENLKREKENLRAKKRAIEDSVNKIKRQINSISSVSALYSFMEQYGISRDSLSKVQKILLSVDQLGIGRSFVDYSELTVKNITLTGGTLELNPGSFYFAAAAGKVNYRYRDFIFKNSSIPNQMLYLFRAGVGKKEGNDIILTFYNGKKTVLQPIPGNNTSDLQKVLGLSLEGRLAINANNYVIAEVAKSSYNGHEIEQQGTNLLKKAFNFTTHSNEAYSIKLFSENLPTDTRITGYYKRLGENFQSFNLYPFNINQTSWLLRVNQNLWKRKLMVEASVRKNDFLSSIAVPSSYSTKVIFKSLRLSMKIPKYPFFSVGFYPSSQLSLKDNNVLMESRYNTLNVVIAYNYRIKSSAMSTNAVFTRFYNTSNDTGFIYFNASSYSINHSIFFSELTSETGITLIEQKDTHLFTIQQSAGYRLGNTLSLNIGLKWNRFNKTQNLLGAMSTLSVYIKKVGTFQINYDKSYLPGYDQTLKAVDIGRIILYKEF